MKAIQDRLRERIGFDVRALGTASLERLVRAHMRRAGIDTVDEYARILARVPREWEDLIESVVVPETWFFRDAGAFEGLTRFVVDDWFPRGTGRPLRILSLPCSSGEEPYSIAMALLDEGLSPDRFCVDAVDISARALARAQLGVYGKNAFRSRDLGFRSRYFQRLKTGFVLHDLVKKCVRFERGNLLSEDWLPRTWKTPADTVTLRAGSKGDKIASLGGCEHAIYDCIFCRNLLIYFDEDGQSKALGHLRRLLHPKGILVVGGAEQGVTFNSGFIPAGVPMAFNKAMAAAREEKRLGASAWPATPAGLSGTVYRAEELSSSQVRMLGEAPPGAEAETPAEDALELMQARKLADAGRLDEACLLCQSFLETHPDSASAYYLLGLIRDALGHPNAAEYYRRALYLDPQHQQVIAQLVLSAERAGDYKQAENLRRRAQRSGSRGEP